jgi:ribonuclease P protein component
VVPKAVGGAVVRNRVKRQLRHLLAARIVDLPWGSSVVVRAEAGSAGLSSAELAGHLDAALAAAVNRTAVDRPAVNRMAPR